MRKITKKMALFMLMSGITSVSAAKMYVLPSNTQLSGNENWVTFDAAYADDIFIPVHGGIKLDQVHITAPSGQKAKAENGMEGELRTVFDLKLSEKGTYAVAVESQKIWVKHQPKDAEKHEWWGGTQAELDEKLKDKAFVDGIIEIRNYNVRADAFVSLGEPTDNGLKAKDKGFDLDFLTHPNDFYVGETAEFVLKKDGKPLADTELKLERASARFLPSRDETTLTTDANGKISIDWKNAGRYVLSIEFKGEKPKDKLKAQQRIRYYATFEVLGE